MGGCINQPKKLRTKNSQINFEAKKPGKMKEKKNSTEERVDDDSKPIANPNIKIIQQKQLKPRNKKITSSQFASQYRIQQNVGTASRMEAPKFVSNIIDGSCKVLRVLNFGDYDEKRLRTYAELLKLDIYEDQDSNILVLQNYYCGPTLDQLTRTDQKQEENRANITEQIRQFISQIYLMIYQFHEKDMTLGNLNLFSFRHCSEFDRTVVLTDLSFNLNFDDFMGHANKDGLQADWESFGYILQTVMNQWPPIFIPHKIQYMDTGNSMINNLLKGRKIKLDQLNLIKDQQLFRPKISVIAGYKLRRDVNKLLRIRKRRTHHLIIYYPLDAIDNGKGDSKNRLSQDLIHRLETSRILDRIQSYIDEVDVHSQQAFLNYSDGNEKLKKLKAVFMLKEKEKKFQQLKETLVFLK